MHKIDFLKKVLTQHADNIPKKPYVFFKQVPVIMPSMINL